MNDLLLMDETAEAMRQTEATLRYWRHIGYGPPSAKFGRRVVYRRADVEAWVEAQFESGGADAA